MIVIQLLVTVRAVSRQIHAFVPCKFAPFQTIVFFVEHLQRLQSNVLFGRLPLQISKGLPQRQPPFIFSYVQGRVVLFASAAEGNSSAANQKRHHEKQAGGVDVEIEVFHLTAAAAQKQDNEQNPCAVASAKASAAVFAVSASAVVKHSVEHILPPFAEQSALY